MPRLPRTFIALAALTLSVSLIGPAAGPASGGTYAPGKAIAYKVNYDYDTSSWLYNCAFTNWRSGAKVVWHCELHDIHSAWPWGGGLIDTKIQDHSGSWTPPPSTKMSGTYHLLETAGTHGQLCVVARALSVDGGSTMRYCN